jgi:hypothetical protein
LPPPPSLSHTHARTLTLSFFLAASILMQWEAICHPTTMGGRPYGWGMCIHHHDIDPPPHPHTHTHTRALSGCSQQSQRSTRVYGRTHTQHRARLCHQCGQQRCVTPGGYAKGCAHSAAAYSNGGGSARRWLQSVLQSGPSAVAGRDCCA